MKNKNFHKVSNFNKILSTLMFLEQVNPDYLDTSELSLLRKTIESVHKLKNATYKKIKFNLLEDK